MLFSSSSALSSEYAWGKKLPQSKSGGSCFAAAKLRGIVVQNADLGCNNQSGMTGVIETVCRSSKPRSHNARQPFSLSTTSTTPHKFHRFCSLIQSVIALILISTCF
jgi:hypothetical protein